VQGATERIARFYCDKGRRLFHLPLNFVVLDVAWNVDAVAAVLDEYLSALPEGSWPDWVLGSHDKCRIATRIGSAQARVAAMLLFTLPGTPIFYAGDEIGMRNGPVSSGEAKDPFERLVPGYGLNRDPERAPMRWDATRNAGFTSGTPWLPVGDGVAECNVSVQRRDSHSMLALYQRLIRLRRKRLELCAGTFEPARSVGNVVLYTRRHGDSELRVFLNIGDATQEVPVSRPARVLLSTHLDREGARIEKQLELRPHEGLILD
jgi:alpha-glucosidase